MVGEDVKKLIIFIFLSNFIHCWHAKPSAAGFNSEFSFSSISCSSKPWKSVYPTIYL